MNLLDLAVKVSCDTKEAEDGVESLSSWTIAKGTVIGNAMTSALSGAMNAVKTAAGKLVDFAQTSLNAYSQYEQLKGGVETLYKSSSETVLKYAQNAYKTAGLSANQYMETATSFASTLVQSVAKGHQEVVQRDIDAEKHALDVQLKNEKQALSDAYDQQRKAYSQNLSARKKEQQEEYESYKESLDEELAELKESNAQRVKDTQESQKQQVKDFEAATNERIKLMEQEYNESLKLLDEEEYRRVKAIDDQIDALNAQTDAERAAIKRQEQAQRKSELEQAVSSAKTDEERAKAREKLSDYIKKLEQEEREAARKAQIDKLKDQKTQVKAEMKSRKDLLKEQYKQELEAYKESRAEQKEEMLKAQKEELEQLKKNLDSQYDQKQKEYKRQLSELKSSQSDELESLKEYQDQQLDAMKRSQQAQYDELAYQSSLRKKALEDEAKAGQAFAEATEEDYAEAARLANVAITDMADNANKFGTKMESLQYAYNGFAKQNFSMLDNLKLGYGGTKAEMERLLQDAEALKAKQGEVKDYSIESFADIIDAIHTVQVEYGASGYAVDELAQKLQERSLTEQELHRISQDLYASRSQQYQDEQDAYNQVVEAYQNGSLSIQDALILTGTTSYEASRTIEGSLNALQGAWENWLVSLASDDMNVEETTTNLVDAAIRAGENIIPRVGKILATLAKVVAEKGPEALAKLKEAFLNSLPPEWREKIEGFGRNVDDFIKKLEPLKKWLEENIPKAMETLGDVFDSFTSEDGAGKKFLDFLDGLVKVITTVGDVFNTIGTAIGVSLADLVAGFEGTENVGGTVFYNIGEFFRKCGEVFDNIGKWIGDRIKDVEDFFTGMGETFDNVGKNVQQTLDNIGGFFDDMGKGIDETINGIIQWFKDLPQNILNALGNLGDLLFGAGQDIMNGFWDGLDDVWGGLTGWIGGIGEWIQGNKGPKEYDLKLLTPNGRWIMESLENGLRDQFPEIGKTLNDLSDYMYDEMDTEFTFGGTQKAKSGPVIYVGEMVVREEADIYKVSNTLDLLWQREADGVLA